MRHTIKKSLLFLLTGIFTVLWAVIAQADIKGTDFLATLNALGPADELPVIVTFSDKANLSFYREKDKHERRQRIVQGLKEKAALVQKPVIDLLESRGVTDRESLWIMNGLAVRAGADVIRELMHYPGIESITLDYTLSIQPTTYGAPAAPEWNLTSIRAPELWNIGINGAGLVVANMDTGVDYNHPDLKNKWRGGTRSWYDPFNHSALPYDAVGHGTQTMGIMVGGTAGGTAIGVAPGAKWIAAKIFNDAGNSTLSEIHKAFQWLLNPDGNLNTTDAPDIVNASWGLDNVNSCDLTFEEDIAALKAAGVFVVFSAGNSGPALSSSVSPANNPSAYATGAVDDLMNIASFSSRGPSACGGTIFPEVVAPGVNIRTSDISLAGIPLFATVTGTSFTAPHAAGAAALLLDAFPALTVEALESALQTSAIDLGAPGPDDNFGYGLIDVYATYAAIAQETPMTIVTSSLPDVAQGTAYSACLQATGGAMPYTWSVTAGALPPGLTIDSSTGVISGIPAVVGAFSFTVQVQDFPGNIATRSFSITVRLTNRIQITAPARGEVVYAGRPYTIRWTYTGNPGSAVKIELLYNNIYKATIVASTRIGSNGAGYYVWNVPTSLLRRTGYAIRITSTTNSRNTAGTDGAFIIR